MNRFVWPAFFKPHQLPIFFIVFEDNASQIYSGLADLSSAALEKLGYTYEVGEMDLSICVAIGKDPEHIFEKR